MSSITHSADGYLLILDKIPVYDQRLLEDVGKLPHGTKCGEESSSLRVFSRSPLRGCEVIFLDHSSGREKCA